MKSVWTSQVVPLLLLLSAPAMTYGRHDNRLVTSTNLNGGKSQLRDLYSVMLGLGFVSSSLVNVNMTYLITDMLQVRCSIARTFRYISRN